MLHRPLICLVVCASGLVAAACGSDAVLVLDLVDSLDEAELWLETAEIDVGSESSRRHLVDGWLGFGERWLGRNDLTFEWSGGASSTLLFHVFEPRDITLRFAGRPHAVQERLAVARITLIVNDTPLATVAVEPGWHEYAQTLPRQTLRSGENRVTFLYDGGETPAGIERDRRFAWNTVSFDRTRVTSPAQRALGSASPTLLVPYLSRVVYTLAAPAGAALELDRIAPFGPHGDADTGSLVVSIRDANGQPREIRFDGDDANRAIRVPLTAAPGELRIVLTALPAPTGERMRPRDEAVGLLLERPVVSAPAGPSR